MNIQSGRYSNVNHPPEQKKKNKKERERDKWKKKRKQHTRSVR